MDLQPADFRFHSNHGRNIKLVDDERTAELRDTGCSDDGIVMSQEPMEVGKMYEVWVLATDDLHSLSLAVGIVTKSPEGLELPKISYPWEHAVVLFWGSVAVHGDEREIQDKEVLVQLPVNTRVGVMVDMRKSLHFYVDRQEKVVIPCPEQTETFYFMLDLCGTCSKVAIGNNSPSADQSAYECESQTNQPCDRRSTETLPKPDDFVFHFHRGNNILLSNDMRTAERRGLMHTGGGIVMSRDPMVIGKLYQVQIDNKTRDSIFWSLAVGVVLCNPCELTTVPDTTDGWRASLFFRWDAAHDRGFRVRTQVGRELLNLPQHDHVGVCVDRNRQLHLYVHGRDMGVFPNTEVSGKCYAMFHLYGPYYKVTALPVTEVP